MCDDDARSLKAMRETMCLRKPRPTTRIKQKKLHVCESFEQTTLSEDISNEPKYTYEWTTQVLKNNIREMLSRPIRRLRKSSKLLSSMEEGAVIDFSKCSRDEVNHLFLWAAFLGNVSYAENLIEFGADVATLTETGGLNALHVAALNGLLQFCDWLLLNNCPVTETNNQLTPTHYAVLGGSLDLLKFFITKNLSIPDTVINSAVYAGALDCLQFLLQLVVDVNVYHEGVTALHVAADLGSVQCMKELLVHPEININIKASIKGNTALHISAENGYTECIELLTKYGAKVNEVNSKQQTALHLACKMKYIDCISVLLKNYASVNLADVDGKTPLHVAITKGVNALPIVEKLVEWEANINATDRSGLSPLHIAAMSQLKDCADYLILHGANLMLQTVAGISALNLIQREIPASISTIHERFTQYLAFNKEQCLKFSFRELLMYSKVGEIDYLYTLSTVSGNEILKHPLCKAFLYLKWEKIKPFYLLRLFCVLVLVGLISAYVIMFSHNSTNNANEGENNETWNSAGCECNSVNTFMSDQKVEFSNKTLNSTETSSKINNETDYQLNKTFGKVKNFFNFYYPLKAVCQCNTSKWNETSIDIFIRISKISNFSEKSENEKIHPDNSSSDSFDCSYLLLPIGLLTFVNILLIFLRETAHKSMKKYITQSYNILEFITISSTIVLCFLKTYENFKDLVKIMSPVVVLLNWIYLTINIGQLPLFGAYITMFKRVFEEFVKLLLTYLCLLFGFTCTFCVLFPQNFFFKNPFTGFVKVMLMMTGEIDMNDDLESDSGCLKFVVFIILTGFVILVTVVLMNLLIGIAVQDVEGLRKTADLAKLKQQTELIHSLELVCFYKYLPKSVSKSLSKFIMVSPGMYRVVIYVRPMHPRENKLPRDVMNEALILAMGKRRYKNDNKPDNIQDRFDSIDEKLAKLGSMLELMASSGFSTVDGL